LACTPVGVPLPSLLPNKSKAASKGLRGHLCFKENRPKDCALKGMARWGARAALSSAALVKHRQKSKGNN